MFEVKYSFSDNVSSDIIKADETDLRYNLFLGSLILKTQKKSIIIDWDWIPLIDFAICLLAICNNLLTKMKGEEEFEFTESDSKVFFQKNGDRIKIITSFSDEVLEMSFEEFQSAVKMFYKSLLFEIVGKVQEIKNNSSFIEYLKEAEQL
ncbi:MAG: hypothetical protein V4615_02495 [Bacteroidota bacterium]